MRHMINLKFSTHSNDKISVHFWIDLGDAILNRKNFSNRVRIVKKKYLEGYWSQNYIPGLLHLVLLHGNLRRSID